MQAALIAQTATLARAGITGDGALEDFHYSIVVQASPERMPSGGDVVAAYGGVDDPRISFIGYTSSGKGIIAVYRA